MPLSSFRCASCGKRTSGRPVETITGRKVCPTCADGILGAAAGVLRAPQGQEVPYGIATSRIFQRLRARRRRKA